MEAADPPLDSPTVSKVLTALLDLRKTYATPYLKRTKLPKPLTDSHIKKILEQLQSTEKQCCDVIGVAQHIGTQLQVRLQETTECRERAEALQRRLGELEALTATQETKRGFIPQSSVQEEGEVERVRSENETLRGENSSLRGEVSGFKAEIRRLRREFAQCDTPKDQLKKQFLEFGLPLELQADIKALTAKSQEQADTLACQSLQLSEITQLCESLQAQLQAKTTDFEATLRAKEDLEGRLKQTVQGATACEKQLKEVKFELMQERFLRERLNRELHGVEIAEIEVQTEDNSEETAVQTERFEGEMESQTEANIGEVACQATMELAEKGVLAVADLKDQSSGEVLSVQHSEVQQDPLVETLEEAEQTDLECKEQETEAKVQTGEVMAQTEAETREIGTETEATGQEVASQTQIAASICIVEGCGVQGIRKSAEMAFAGSISVPYMPPQLALETFQSAEVPPTLPSLSVQTADQITVPSPHSPALSFQTFTWARYSAFSPALRLNTLDSISLLGSSKPTSVPCELLPTLKLHTETWTDIPPQPASSLCLETVLSHYYLPEAVVKLQTELKYIEKSEAAYEAKPETSLVLAEKCDILPRTKRTELEIAVLSGQLITPVEMLHIDTGDQSPNLSLHTTSSFILPTLVPQPLSEPLLKPVLSIVSLSPVHLPGLSPPHTLPTQSYIPSPRSLTLSAGPTCSLQPSSVSTPSLNTQESEGDWGLEACGIINIYPEVKEAEVELFSCTICDIMPIDKESIEMTLVSQAILDLSGTSKPTPSLHISHIPTICDQPALPKRPLQLFSHSLSLPGLSKDMRSALSLHTSESLYVEGFNFRQLFIEAIEEEGKVEEGGRRRTRRRVTRKDPGEEYFIMVRTRQCLQAMKLNCPDIQTVQKADQSALYYRASEAGIPFFKVRSRQWQGWLQGLLLPKAR